MKLVARILGLVTLLHFCLEQATVGFAAEPAQQPAPRKSSLVKFRPPPTAALSGAPSVRVTGGSRGTGDHAVTLDVLAPDQVGETTQEQPSLFWFQSRPATAKFELTVLEQKKVKPVMRFTVEHAMKAGIQRLKLSDHGAKLAPGIEYQWVVALVTDPENRSTDLVASGAIKRVAPGAELTEKLTKASPEERAAIYAEAGIWYDALAVLSDQIEAKPTDATLRQTRADLLRQIGLAGAAQFEAELK
jgi:hypothetical protein